MRQIPVLLCSLALLSTAFGCSWDCLNHTAGVCDCQNDPRGCDRYTMHAPIVPTPVPGGIVTPVPATVAPAVDAAKPMPIPR
jgi:hypothetical protein